EMKYDWACGLDADDIARPERLAVTKAAIQEKPHVVAWGGHARYFNNGGKTLFISELGPTTEKAYAELRQQSQLVILTHSAMTFRRDIALEIGGYNTVLYTCADVDLCDRLCDRGLVLTIPQVMVDYRIHEESTTSTKPIITDYQLRFIWERRAAQDRGETLTWSDYQMAQGLLPPTRYFQQWVSDRSQLYWRWAGVAWGKRDYARMAKLLLMSTVMNPSLITRKLSRQIMLRVNGRLWRVGTEAEGLPKPSALKT
ncbi:MAG: hypothetical protein SF029_03180, partial [bacterium]|nr:hypothetical protein [bacterium]